MICEELVIVPCTKIRIWLQTGLFFQTDKIQISYRYPDANYINQNTCEMQYSEFNWIYPIVVHGGYFWICINTNFMINICFSPHIFLMSYFHYLP